MLFTYFYLNLAHASKRVGIFFFGQTGNFCLINKQYVQLALDSASSFYKYLYVYLYPKNYLNKLRIVVRQENNLNS